MPKQEISNRQGEPVEATDTDAGADEAKAAPNPTRLGDGPLDSKGAHQMMTSGPRSSLGSGYSLPLPWSSPLAGRAASNGSSPLVGGIPFPFGLKSPGP